MRSTMAQTVTVHRYVIMILISTALVFVQMRTLWTIQCARKFTNRASNSHSATTTDAHKSSQPLLHEQLNHLIVVAEIFAFGFHPGENMLGAAANAQAVLYFRHCSYT